MNDVLWELKQITWHILKCSECPCCLNAVYNMDFQECFTGCLKVKAYQDRIMLTVKGWEDKTKNSCKIAQSWLYVTNLLRYVRVGQSIKQKD